MGMSHAFASYFHLYWRYPLLDVPLHILGGMLVAFSFYLLPVIRIRLPRRYPQLVYVIALALIVGTLWELFEYAIGETEFGAGFAFDTLRDIGMDTVGAIAGFYFIRQFNEF